MKKLILLVLLICSSMNIFSQPKLLNTLFTIGHTFQNDLSIEIGGKFSKDGDFIATYEYGYNFKTNFNYNYINFGIVTNNNSVIMVKWGAKTQPYEGSHINYFDYGIEYLWIIEKNNSNLCYGLTATEKNGVGFKIGLMF